MSKKLLSVLALLAVGAQGELCEAQGPFAAQNNVMMVGVGVGMASMKDTLSGTSNYNMPKSLTSDIDTSALTDSFTTYIPLGYRANLQNLTPMAAKMGFAGVLDVHYAMRHGDFGVGLYAAIGLNQSKTSSRSISFNGSTQATAWENNGGAILGESMNGGLTSTVETYDVNLAANPRATVTSGLNFQVGMRPGMWIGNMFFHGRIGWQILNLQSKISGVYKPFERVIVQEDNEIDLNEDNYEPFTDTAILGQQSSFVKNKWVNALTLGAGLDIAYKKFVYGFYYQAAICQRVNFKYNQFTVGETANALTDDNGVTTWTQKYGASNAQLSIQPVISTFMVTVKYVFHKA